MRDVKAYAGAYLQVTQSIHSGTQSNICSTGQEQASGIQNSQNSFSDFLTLLRFLTRAFMEVNKRVATRSLRAV